MILRLPKTTLFPYTTLFRSRKPSAVACFIVGVEIAGKNRPVAGSSRDFSGRRFVKFFSTSRRFISAAEGGCAPRSEEHTSELQSRRDLVCRLLLEKKKKDD